MCCDEKKEVDVYLAVLAQGNTVGILFAYEADRRMGSGDWKCVVDAFFRTELGTGEVSGFSYTTDRSLCDSRYTGDGRGGLLCNGAAYVNSRWWNHVKDDRGHEYWLLRPFPNTAKEIRKMGASWDDLASVAVSAPDVLEFIAAKREGTHIGKLCRKLLDFAAMINGSEITP